MSNDFREYISWHDARKIYKKKNMKNMNKDKPDCDHCGKELTVGDHPSCCSDCWEENAKYYE